MIIKQILRNYCCLIMCLFPLLSYAEFNLSENSTLDYGFTMRVGMGLTQNGETQVEFKLPDAVTKYRLGNEADTNLKFALDYQYHLDDEQHNPNKSSKKSIQSVIMLDGYDKHGDGNDISLSKLGQGYLSFNNIIADGTKIWIGRRWYKRTLMYMSDHFWLNTGQNARMGAGVEGIKLAKADFSAALFYSEDSAAIDSNSDSPPQDAVNSTALDFRLENMPFNLPFGLNSTSNPDNSGTLNFWLYYNMRPKNEHADLDSETGIGIALWHEQPLAQNGVDIGNNRFHIMYRNGTAVSRSDFNPNPLMNDGRILDTQYLEIANDLVTKISQDWELGFKALYRKSEEKTLHNTVNKDWYSIGIRPQYTVNQYLSVVFELGHDHVITEQRKGGLTKLSTALQLGVKPGYWSRPVVRLFVTLASWDEQFRGAIGGQTFSSDTFGWTAGIQAEWWKW